MAHFFCLFLNWFFFCCHVVVVFFKGTNQHDVQELNRILFSALEHSLVGTSGSTFIHRLYHGTIVNSIVCKECGNVSQRQVCVQTQTRDITEHDAIKCVLNAKRTIINEPNLFVFFRRTSWTWQCVFVVCLVWKTLCGTCLWQKSCLRAITYTAVHSVTDWSLLPRSVPIFRQRKYSSEEYNAVNICTFLPCSTLQWFLPLYLH